jgi:hypothetical protein
VDPAALVRQSIQNYERNWRESTEVHWVAAESLGAALRYMRRRNDDFTITEARFLGMIPLLSGSPLD